MSTHSDPGLGQRQIAQREDREDCVSESARLRRPTLKGRAYQLEIKNSVRKAAYSKLKKQIQVIEHETSAEVLCAGGDKLDSLKDEFNQAQIAYDDLLETESQKQTAYQWYDVRDREYTECRMRVCERIRTLERNSISSAKSHRSGSGSGRSSRSRSSNSLRLEAAAKSARLKTELKFIEKEREIREFQLRKEIAIAEAEEKAMKELIDDAAEAPVKAEETKKEFSAIEEPKLSPHASAFIPDVEPRSPASVPDRSSEETLKAIVSLQEKQTELTSLIIHQQKVNSLPVKEPPIFNGDPFEFPSFVTAFDAIISENVPTDRDRLYFLEKYTSGKANDVVRGFLSVTTATAYQEARKLLEAR